MTLTDIKMAAVEVVSFGDRSLTSLLFIHFAFPLKNVVLRCIFLQKNVLYTLIPLYRLKNYL